MLSFHRWEVLDIPGPWDTFPIQHWTHLRSYWCIGLHNDDSSWGKVLLIWQSLKNKSFTHNIFHHNLRQSVLTYSCLQVRFLLCTHPMLAGAMGLFWYQPVLILNILWTLFNGLPSALRFKGNRTRQFSESSIVTMQHWSSVSSIINLKDSTN